MPAANTTATVAVSRIVKMLALAASAAKIGSSHESMTCIENAMRIAAREGIEIGLLARAAGVVLPPPPMPAPAPRTVETGVYATAVGTLTRTISADLSTEVCTRGQHGRTEVYFDEDGSGIRSFIGYADEISAGGFRPFPPPPPPPWRPVARHFPVAPPAPPPPPR